MEYHHAIVRSLHALLERRPELKSALENAINRAKLDAFTDMETFYQYVSRAVHQVPRDSDKMQQHDLAFYYVQTISENGILIKDPEFQAWNNDFNEAWGDFLDSSESMGHLESYIKDRSFEIDDYICPRGGWRSFNQFFARQMKPGRRPVAGLCDSRVVVSPCDGVVMEIDRISETASITSKGATFPISELLKESPHAADFDGGVYWSIFLQLFNYHRLHTPVSGKVLESRKIPGIVGMTIQKKGDELVPVPEPGFEFTQDRGLIVMENDLVGKVAIVPVGMAQISSVELTAEVGAELHKGEECGYFQFGGSNIIMLTQAGAFEPAKEHLKAYDSSQMGIPYNQGERVGRGHRPSVVEQASSSSA